MANKTPAKKAAEKTVITRLTEPVTETVREALYASLGVFSVVSQEGGKLVEEGGKLFDRLIAEGAELEKKSVELAETAVGDIRHEFESKFEDIGKQAIESIDSFGQVIDERVTGTLERLGIPTTDDLDDLSGRVKKVTRQATDNWKEFENVFEQRVSAVLENLHVPGKADLTSLSDKIQSISKEAMDKLASLEANLEVRVKRMMADLDIPGASDIEEVSAELRKLNEQVNNLEKQLKAGIKDGQQKSTARKTAAPGPVTEKVLTVKPEVEAATASAKKPETAV